MKIQKEELGNSQVQLTIEVDEAQLAQAKKKAVRHAAQHVNIPGFRKGKAPEAMVIRTVGEPAILEEAIETLLPEALEQGVKESETRVYSYEHVEADIENVDPLTFRFVIPVMPNVRLGNLDDVTVDLDEPSVDDEQVEEVIQNLRKQRGVWEPSLGPAAFGDRATLDLRGDLMDGTTVADQKGLEITLIEREEDEEEEEAAPDEEPDIAPHLVGMMVNQVKEFPLVYPEGYPEARMAGRTVLYRATLLDLKRQQEAALDDEFAQSVGDFNTVDELRARIRENMLAQAKDEAFNKAVEAILDALADESELEYPQAMVEHEIERRVERLKQQVQGYGIDWDLYLNAVQKSQDEIEDDMRDAAEEFVRRSLTLMEYVTANEIQATEEEIERELDLVLGPYGPNAAELRQRIRQEPEQLSDIINSVINRKALNGLYTAVTGEEAPPLFPEVEEDEEEMLAFGELGDEDSETEEIPAETTGEPAMPEETGPTPASQDEPGHIISAPDSVPESAAPRDIEELAPVALSEDEPSDPALTATDGVPEEGQPFSGTEG